MGKKKSLGSSPVGYSGLNDSSLDFIRDLGVSEKNDSDSEESPTPSDSGHKSKPAYMKNMRSASTTGIIETNSVTTNQKEKGSNTDKKQKKKSEKKIVSYYLEKSLIQRIKKIAHDRGLFYSSLVGQILEQWVEREE